MNIVLVGNPNCGKTTLYNNLTGEKLKVGNRIGVTVEPVRGEILLDSERSATSSERRLEFFAIKSKKRRKTDFEKTNEYGQKHAVPKERIYIYDLPGIYSLNRPINEEKITADFLENERVDMIINVIDARKLLNGLLLTTQLLASGKKVAVLLNMTDALSGGSAIDAEKLGGYLGCKVFKISAKNGSGVEIFSEILNGGTETLFPGASEIHYEKLKKLSKEFLSETEARTLSDRIDGIILNKYLAFPLFLAIMSLTLCFTVAVFGNIAGGLLGRLVDSMKFRTGNFLRRAGAGEVVTSLVADGVLTGIGGVLEFAPLVCALFFLLSVLENCGYLSRVALITDRLFRDLGMSGQAAISLILGCGCTVPAILSCRTVDNPDEKKRLLYTVHFMPCSALLPLIALISTRFFGSLWAIPLSYFIGAGTVLLVNAAIPNRIKRDFISELPSLQFPPLKVVASDTAIALKSFLRRACTVVFCASVFVWALKTFDFEFRITDIGNSILAKLGGIFAIFLKPLGLGDWRIAVAVIAGFAGKETVVGALEVMSGGDVGSVFSPFSAAVFLLYMLLSSPCATSLSALRKELGRKEFVKCFLFQTVFAYAACFLFCTGGKLAGLI